MGARLPGTAAVNYDGVKAAYTFKLTHTLFSQPTCHYSGVDGSWYAHDTNTVNRQHSALPIVIVTSLSLHDHIVNGTLWYSLVLHPTNYAHRPSYQGLAAW
jgi:hypothetical protein